MPLLWLSIAFGSGILFAGIFPDFTRGYLIFFCIALITGFFEQHRHKNTSDPPGIYRFTSVPYGFLVAAILFGAFRYSASLPNWTANDLAWYNDEENIRFTGMINASPENTDGLIQLKVKARQKIISTSSNQIETVDIDGNVLVFIRTADIWQYGDIVELHGKPITPQDSEDFSYKDYLAQRNIHSLMYYPRIQLIEHNAGNPLIQLIFQLRHTFYQNIMQMLPLPEASLLSGILLGLENDIPEDVQNNFRNTGTTHIIAISGFNIAILAALFTVIFNNILRDIWKSLLATVFFISIYTIMVGSDPSVVRAAIMGIMGLFGRLIGRKQAGANSLFFAGAVMCWFNPQLLWDVSFQLSFTATFGLIMFADPLLNGFTRFVSQFTSEENARKLSGPAGEYFFFTIAAQITTIPVIAAHFHQISLNSLLANTLILPAQPAIMVLGGISAILSLLFPHISQAVAYLAWIPLTYSIHIIEWVANYLPAAIIVDEIKLIEIAAYYFTILVLRLYWKQISKFLQPGILIGGTISAGALAVITWQFVMDKPDGLLHIDLIRDEEGHTSVLLTDPSGRVILIDYLTENRLMYQFLDDRLPIFSRTIDFLFLTDYSHSLDQDFTNLSERYAIRSTYIQNNMLSENERETLHSVENSGHMVRDYQSGQSINLTQTGALWMFTTPDMGTTFYIEWLDLNILIPQNTRAKEILQNPYQKIQDIDILVLSKKETKSITADELMLYHPEFIFSASNCADMILETDVNCIDLVGHGNISMVSDGENIWLTSD